jgi:MarR family transcriptional regulator, organic hydroperoxide resistance regulator
MVQEPDLRAVGRVPHWLGQMPLQRAERAGCAASRPDSMAGAPRRYDRAMSTVAKVSAPRKRPKAATPKELPGQVLRRFRVVFNAIKAHFRQIEKVAGVGGAQLWALGVVQSHPGIGMTELARAMDVHQSTASNLVKSLVERELIALEKTGTDRRTVALRVLPAGRKVLRAAPGHFTGVLPDALASLDTRTLSRLDKDLGKLIAALRADEDAAGVPLGE